MIRLCAALLIGFVVGFWACDLLRRSGTLYRVEWRLPNVEPPMDERVGA